MNVQPCSWMTTLLAGLDLGGSDPCFILSVSYHGLMLLYMLHSCCTHAFIHSQLGNQLYASLHHVLGSFLIFSMWTATIDTYTFHLCVLIEYMSQRPCSIDPYK